jgi:4-diphosphocytidyl-2-C-methyl-D-erythritol kinase
MIALKAPAKINLSLRVLGRRPDGYHDVDSVMQMVGLYDDVEVAPGRRGLNVFVEGADLPEGPGNLVYEAATALAKAAGVSTGASIRLTKRIPIGAGLGGGSSDAAAALMALNRLWRLRWPRTRLAELGAGLGSDVPFFFFGPTARVAGRGELVARAARPRLVGEPQPLEWAVLVNPGFSVSTRWAFQRLTKERSIVTIPRSFGAPVSAPCPVENSLEAVTASSYPVIEEIKRWLRDAGAGVALMSGSGPTVFGLFSSRAEAVRARVGLPQAWMGWVVKLLRRAPW